MQAVNCQSAETFAQFYHRIVLSHGHGSSFMEAMFGSANDCRAFLEKNCGLACQVWLYYNKILNMIYWFRCKLRSCYVSSCHHVVLE